MGYNKLKYKTNQRHERKALFIELLGGCCVECSSVKNLNFDHVLPEEKEFHISANLDYSLEKILPELQKCQLLCKPCHDIKSVLDRGDNYAIHGSVSMYTNKRCRCDSCRSAWADYSLKYTHAYRARQAKKLMVQ